MTLVILAHGSCNPAAARTVEAVAARVRLRLGGVPVRTAYAGINRPSLAEVLADLAGDAVVVPLPCAQDAARPDSVPARGEPLVTPPRVTQPLVTRPLVTRRWSPNRWSPNRWGPTGSSRG